MDQGDIVYQYIPFIRRTRVPDLKQLFGTASLHHLVIKCKSRLGNVRVFLVAWKVKADGSPYIYDGRQHVMDVAFVEIVDEGILGPGSRGRKHPLMDVFMRFVSILSLPRSISYHRIRPVFSSGCITRRN